jgi:hypothetical protein
VSPNNLSSLSSFISGTFDSNPKGMNSTQKGKQLKTCIEILIPLTRKKYY